MGVGWPGQGGCTQRDPPPVVHEFAGVLPPTTLGSLTSCAKSRPNGGLQCRAGESVLNVLCRPALLIAASRSSYLEEISEEKRRERSRTGGRGWQKPDSCRRVQHFPQDFPQDFPRFQEKAGESPSEALGLSVLNGVVLFWIQSPLECRIRGQPSFPTYFPILFRVVRNGSLSHVASRRPRSKSHFSKRTEVSYSPSNGSKSLFESIPILFFFLLFLHMP